MGGTGPEEETENSNSTSESSVSEEKINLDIPFDIEKFYSIFIEGHENARTDFKSVITKTIDSYRAVGLNPFEDPSDTDKEKISDLEGKYISAAETKWGRTKGDRIPPFQAAVSQLIVFFTGPEKQYRIAFRNILWDNQMNQLKAAVQSKVDDKILDTYELVSLVNQAKEYGLCNTDEDKKNAIKFIRDEAVAFGAKLNSFEDDFLDSVRVLDSTKRMDLPECFTPLFNQYQGLYEQSVFLGESKSDEEDEVLRKNMRQLLEKNGLGLVDNIELFKKEKFDVFVKEYAINLDAPLSSALFYSLKESAKSIYKFTENQWKEFISSKGMIAPNEKKQEFSLGIAKNGELLKTTEINEIPALFDRDPERAKSRLYDGDIEVYLTAVERQDLLQKICEIRTRDYPDDKDAGLIKAKYILDDEKPCVLEDGKQFSEKKEIAAEYEKNFSFFVDKVTSVKNPSVKLWLEARNFDSNVEDVKNALSQNTTNEYKFNRIILSLQDNNYVLNKKEYKNPSELIKDKDESKKVVTELLNVNSKLTCWIVNFFKDLEPNVKKWRDLERNNTVTYTYALEQKSPFYFDGKKINDYKELEKYFSENADDKDFLKAFFQNSNLEEVDFWAVNYQGESLRKLLLFFLDKTKTDEKKAYSFVQVMDYLSVQTIAEKRTEDYFYEVLPVLRTATNSKVISEDYYSEKKNIFFNYLTGNKGPQTDQIVKTFLDKELKNQNVDKEIVYRLIKYFFREDVDHAFYETNIHPIIDSSIKAGLISEDIRREENSYFVMKYVQELPKMSAKVRVSTLESIEKLEPLNPHVLAYKQAVVSAKKSVKLERACRVFSNFKNCGLILMFMTFVGSVAFGLMSLPNYVSFMGPKLSWILSLVFLFFIVKAAFKVYEVRKNKKVGLNKYTNKDLNNAVSHVVNEIEKGFHTPYKRKNQFGVGQVFAAIFVWAFTCAFGYIMYYLSMMNMFSIYISGLIGLLTLGFVFGFLRKKV